MHAPYQSFVDTQFYKFLIGPFQKALYIHSGLVTQLSDTLAKFVTGGMVEAQEQCAKIEDVDETTFVCFIEYAYTKEYSVPEPEIVPIAEEAPPEETPAEEAPAVEDADWPVAEEMPDPEPEPEPFIWSNSFHKKSKKGGFLETKKDQVWKLFKEKATPKPATTWEPRENEEDCEDYTQIFLCHASLYVFADRYNIEPLRSLALHKLRRNLSTFNLFEARVGDVVELLDYTYAKTRDRDDGLDELRDLVSDYIVCHLETIAKHQGFLELLQAPGQMSRDIISKVSLQRLE